MWVRRYTVNLYRGTGCTAVSGGGTFDAGTSITITATGSSDYEFSKWIDDDSGTTFSSRQTYSFTVNDNWNLTAEFAVKTYTVTSGS